MARDRHDIFAGGFLARHEARRAQESNNEKGDKEDWQVFFLPPSVEGKKFIREYICVGICIAVVPETVVCVLIRKAVNKLMCM